METSTHLLLERFGKMNFLDILDVLHMSQITVAPIYTKRRAM